MMNGQKPPAPKENGHGMSIFLKVLLTLSLLALAPAIFSNLLTMLSYEEVVSRYLAAGTDTSGRALGNDLALTAANVKIQIIFLVLLVLVFSLFVAVILSRNLTDPIKRLIAGTKNLAMGQLDYRLDIKSPPEIAALAESFNQMAADIEKINSSLAAERDRIGAIIMQLTDGLIVLDDQECVILMNPQAKTMLGFLNEQVDGTRIDQKLMNSKETCWQNLGHVFFDGHNDAGNRPKEVELKTPNEIVLKVSSSSLYDQRGILKGTMKILSDITQERYIDRMKSEFISVAAHQLRTPLTAIKWSLKMAMDGDGGALNEEQADILSKASVASDRLIELVNDLLNVSRIEAGRMGYNLVAADFRETINNVIALLTERMKRKGQTFKIEGPAKLPLVKIDKEKMHAVVQNLLDNAVKYTPDGGLITLKLKVERRHLEVQVVDSGVGIPEKDRKRLFSKFFRASNVIQMQTEGTGLGLFVVKNIVEKHGGKVDVESEEGKGTTFTFTIPLANDEKTGVERYRV